MVSLRMGPETPQFHLFLQPKHSWLYTLSVLGASSPGIFSNTKALGRRPCCGIHKCEVAARQCWGAGWVSVSQRSEVTCPLLCPSAIPVRGSLPWDYRGFCSLNEVRDLDHQFYSRMNIPEWSPDKWEMLDSSQGIVSHHMNNAPKYTGRLLPTPFSNLNHECVTFLRLQTTCCSCPCPGKPLG